MGRITFYLLILAVILILYVYLTKEKYLKPIQKHENFDIEEEPIVKKKTKTQDDEEEVVKAPSPAPSALPPPKERKIDLDKFMETIKTYNDNVVELNDNIKDLLAENKSKQQPNYLWY